MRWGWVMAAMAAAVAAAAARAQEPSRHYKDGPFVGRVSGGDVGRDHAAFGYQVARDFGHFLSAELSAYWQADESPQLAAAVPGLPAGSALDLQVIALALTGRLGARPIENLNVYLGWGAGYYAVKADNKDIRRAAAAGPQPGPAFVEADVEKGLGTHFAAGLELALTERWEAIVEYRRVEFDTRVRVRRAAGGDRPVVATAEDFGYDHGMVRVGLNYRF